MKSLLRNGAAALAVFVLLAVAASSAQALEWKVAGAKLLAKETITGNNIDPATTKAVPFKFEVPTEGSLVVECPEVTVTGDISPANKGTQKIELKKCIVVASPCEVEAPPQFSVETELKEFSGVAYNVMKPAGGGALLFNLKLKNCGIAGNHEIKGEACSKTEAKGVEAVSYPFAFTKAHQESCEAGGITSLVYEPNKEPAYFKGTIWATLSGGNKGKKWGIG